MNKNWSYIPFSQIVEWQEKSKIKSGDGKTVGKYKMFICSDTAVKKYDESLVDKEALIFGTGGKASLHYCNEKFAYSTDCVVACKKDNHDCNNLKFYYYYLRQNRMQLLQKDFTGSGLQHTSKKKIGALMVPLPDIDEQNKIVAKIEELFSELDKAVDTLQNIKKQLAVYRQAVLKEAFEKFSNYDTIKNVSNIVTSGSRNWSKYYSDQGAKFIRIGNLTRTDIKINSSEIQFVKLPANAEGKRTKLQPNDVLVSITADLGSIGLVPDDIGEAYINQHIAMIRFKIPEQGKFMALYLRSEYGQKDLLKNKRGAGKLGLGLDDIRRSHVPIVTDAQAYTTVQKIESRFSVCDNIEKTIDTALLQSEALRQTILKQAFEGELIK